MAAGTFTVYRANIDNISLADLNATANLRLALVSSAYTPDATNTGHSLWSSVSANEVSATGGYTTGGLTLSSVSTATTTNGWKISSANPSITASGGSVPAWRYGVIYYNGTLWGMVNPLIGYFLGDSTPADIPATTTGNTLTITCPAAGWYDSTEA